MCFCFYQKKARNHKLFVKVAKSGINGKPGQSYAQSGKRKPRLCSASFPFFMISCFLAYDQKNKKKCLLFAAVVSAFAPAKSQNVESVKNFKPRVSISTLQSFICSCSTKVQSVRC